jgi:hypothetical protein
MIRCLCAPCEAATREGRHSVSFQEPQRWEAHSGMSTAKKWKSSVRVVLDPGRGFLGGEGYHTIPVGKWIDMELAGMSMSQAAAAAVAAGAGAGRGGGSGGAGGGVDGAGGLGLPPVEPVDPFDVEAAAATARDLRKAFAAATAAAAKRGGGLKVGRYNLNPVYP